MEDAFDDTPARPARGRRAESRKKQEEENILPQTEATVVPIEAAVSQISLGGDKSEVFQLPKPDKPRIRRSQMWSVAEEEEVDVRLLVEDSEEEETPTIPDLEQLNNEPLANQISDPPMTTLFNELLTYRELDSDLMRQCAFQLLDNEIDLKALTKALILERDVLEADETWEMDSLFMDMQSFVTCCSKNNIGYDFDILAKEKEMFF